MKLIRKFIGVNRALCQLCVTKFPGYFGSNPFKPILLDRIVTSLERGAIDSVLEVGGIDRPLLSKGQGYQYDGLDIESRERCLEIYDDFMVQSIEDPVDKEYDMIVSITLLEHVPNNVDSMRSIYMALKPNGVMHHYVPSKWHPYSVALRMVGPVVQKRLIPLLRPGAERLSGYPAFFNKCSVPAMTAVVEKQGFKNVNIMAFYRASDYFAFFAPFYLVVSTFENICKKFNFTIFASGFIVSADK